MIALLFSTKIFLKDFQQIKLFREKSNTINE